MPAPNTATPALPYDVLWKIFTLVLSRDLRWEQRNLDFRDLGNGNKDLTCAGEYVKRAVKHAIVFGSVSRLWRRVTFDMPIWHPAVDTDVPMASDNGMALWELLVSRAVKSRGQMWLRHVDEPDHPTTPEQKEVVLYKFRQMFLPTLINAPSGSITRIDLNLRHPEYFQGITDAMRASMVDALLNVTHATFGNLWQSASGSNEVQETDKTSAHGLRQLLSFGTPLPSQSCLRVLEMNGIVEDFEHMYMLLQATPLLEELSLESSGEALGHNIMSPPPDNTSHPMVHLPRLRTLHIVRQPFAVTLLLVPRLIVPSLSSFNAVVLCEPPDGATALPEPIVEACIARFGESMMRLLHIVVQNGRQEDLEEPTTRWKIYISVCARLHIRIIAQPTSTSLPGLWPQGFAIGFEGNKEPIPDWMGESLSSAAHAVKLGFSDIEEAEIRLPWDVLLTLPALLTFIAGLCDQVTALSIGGTFHESILACRDHFLPIIVFPRLKTITWLKATYDLVYQSEELKVYFVDFGPLIEFSEWHHGMGMPLIVNRFELNGLDPEFTLDTVATLKAHTRGRFVEYTPRIERHPTA